MKILTTSDIHGDISQLLYDSIRKHNPDVLTISGDVAPTSRILPRSDLGQLGWFTYVFIPFCITFPELKIVMTFGNHDYVVIGDLEDLLIEHDLSHRVFVLINESVNIDGIVFYGNPYSLHFLGWNYNASEVELYLGCSNMCDDVDVFLTHQPPFGVCDRCHEDVFKDTNQPPTRPLGSHSILQIIEEKQPKFVVTGHIHTGSHRIKLVGKSKVINTSILNEEYKSVFEPKLIEI